MAESSAPPQEPPVQLHLKSKDGEKFEVEKEVAMQIQFVKGMLDGTVVNCFYGRRPRFLHSLNDKSCGVSNSGCLRCSPLLRVDAEQTSHTYVLPATRRDVYSLWHF